MPVSNNELTDPFVPVWAIRAYERHQHADPSEVMRAITETVRESVHCSAKASLEAGLRDKWGDVLPSFLSLQARMVEQSSQRVRDSMRQSRRGRPGKAANALSHFNELPAERMILIASAVAINMLGEPLQRVCTTIAKCLETEEIALRLAKQRPDEYKELSRVAMECRGTGYRTRRILKALGDHDGLPFSHADKLALGLVQLEAMRVDGNALFTTKQQYADVSTVELTDWALNHLEAFTDAFTNYRTRSMAIPTVVPLIQEENRLVFQAADGGFTSRRLVGGTKQFKLLTQWEPEGQTLDTLLRTVNTLGSVAFQVDPLVLDVFEHVWAHTDSVVGGLPHRSPVPLPPKPFEGVRSDDMTLSQRKVYDDWRRQCSLIASYNKRERVQKVMQLTKQWRYTLWAVKLPTLHYAWDYDFRGRLYARGKLLSPQGPDLDKGLLRFAHGERLGVNGHYWLCVHGANVYGHDKLPFAERVRWVEEEGKDIALDVYYNPFSSMSVWGKADKPWQFLAWCFEYARYILSEQGEDFESGLVCRVDGTCNGIQHMSILAGDENTARQVNVLGTERSDLYSAVIPGMQRKLPEYKALIRRDLVKQAVMIQPYGGTRRGTYKCFNDRLRNPQLSKAMTAAFEQELAETLPGIPKAKRILSDQVKHLKAHGYQWTLRDGFVVTGQYTKSTVGQINVLVLGRRYALRHSDSKDEPNTRRSRSALLPNIVHSLDSYLCRCLTLCYAESGGRSLIPVHDAFGVPAGSMNLLATQLRHAVHRVYARAPIVELPELHAKLDLSKLNPYMFS